MCVSYFFQPNIIWVLAYSKINWDTLDSENRTYSWSLLITVYNNMFWVRKRNVSETFLFMRQKVIFDREKKLKMIIFVSYIFLCLPLYNSN